MCIQDNVLGGKLWCKEGGSDETGGGGGEGLADTQWQTLTFAPNRKKLILIVNIKRTLSLHTLLKNNSL